MLVLVNFNSYLGGGETLMVRMASYVKNSKSSYCMLCTEQSYIYDDLRKNNVGNIITVQNDKADFYYKNAEERKVILSEIKDKLPQSSEYSFVTFCMRDLYMIIQLTKIVTNAKVCHLVLHYMFVRVCLIRHTKKSFTRRDIHEPIKLSLINHYLTAFVNRELSSL